MVMTNLSTEEDIRRCKDLGAEDVLVKSNMDLDEIWARMKKHFFTQERKEQHI